MSKYQTLLAKLKRAVTEKFIPHHDRLRTRTDAVICARERLSVARRLLKIDRNRHSAREARQDKEDITDSEIQLDTLKSVHTKYVYYYDDVSIYGTDQKRAVDPWQSEA